MIAMNIIDLRKGKRRSLRVSNLRDANQPDRRKGDRRNQLPDKASKRDKFRRVWLTPGERALIEDLYLLLDKE
jgi:hypothetical protein